MLREFGYRAFECPEDLPSGFDWARVRYQRARAVLIRCEQALYLIAMESAAKTNLDKRNDFSELLCRVVSAAQPNTIYLASLSRLIRSLEHSSRVEDAVKRHCKVIRMIDADVALGTPTGAMMWTVLAMIAAGDRDLITQRLFSGRVQSWRLGRWPHGESRAIPLGYRLDDGKLVVDPDQRDLLVAVFELLADESLTLAEVAFAVKELDIAGARRRAAGRGNDADGSWGDVDSPQMLLARLLRWTDVYLTGEYLLPFTNPYPGMDSVLGLPVEVVASDQGPREIVNLPYQLGRPDIDADLVRRAVKVRSAGAGRSTRNGWALNSWSWKEGGKRWWLRGTSRDRYEVLAKIEHAEEWGPMFSPEGVENGTLTAAVNAPELHASMLEAFATGLESGVPIDELELMDSVAMLTGRTPADAARRQIDSRREEIKVLTANKRRAIANSSRYDDQRIADDLLESARVMQDDIERLEREIVDLELVVNAPLGDPKDFETNGEVLMAALSVLAPGVSEASRQARSDLARVIDGFSLRDEGTHVSWECYLLLPAPDRLLRVGPFCGSVARAGRFLPPAVEHDPTNEGRVGSERRELEFRLKSAGMAADAAKCASRAPRMLLPRVLLGEDVVWPDCDDSFDHDQFNTYLRTVWTDAKWAGRQYVRTMPERQVLADLVAAFGGRVSFARLEGPAAELGVGYQKLHYLTREPKRDGVTRPWMPGVVREEVWSSATSKEDHFLLSRRCGNCGEPATAVVRVLEVAGDLLCRSCRVPTVGEGVVFPPIYLELALPPTTIPVALLK